jgi:hypothetical protein
LPDDAIQKKHIHYVREFLRNQWRATLISSDLGKVAFAKLIQGKNEKLALELLSAVLQFKEVEKPISHEFESVVDGYWLDECLSENVEGLTRLTRVKAAQLVLDTMKQLMKKDEHYFNIIWIPTVDGSQEKFGDRFNVILVEFVRLSFAHSKPKDLKSLVGKLLRSRQEIFRRLALHALRIHYKDLKALFWSWAKSNALNDIAVKHELYQLIKTNSSSLTKLEIGKILRWVENIHEKRDDLSKEQQDKVLAYQRKEWLTALLDIKDKRVQDLYKKYDQINSFEVEHPGHTSWVEAGWRSNESPIDMPSLMAKSVKEIVAFVNEFQPDQHSWGKPNKEGLADTLQEAVKNNPQKFSGNLKLFLWCEPRYCYSIVRGFSEAWAAKRDFSWKEVFDFLEAFFSPEEIWSSVFSKGYNYRDWIVSAAADLIADGTRDDEHAFDPQYLSKAEDILLLLLSRSKSNLSESDDVVGAVLNSVFGRLFRSLVNLSLRAARLNPEPKENRWRPKIKSEFTRLSNDPQKPIEFSTCIGEYIRNLLYLDEKWVGDHFEDLFPISNQQQWEAAFSGYLFYANQLQKDLYIRFRNAGSYEKAISTKFKSHNIIERLVQHICIGFNEGFEMLSDETSLISKLFSTEDPDLLYQVVRFYQVTGDSKNDKLDLKLREVWKAVFEIAMKHEGNSEFQKVVSQMCDFIGLVKNLDAEAVALAKGSLKYVEKEYNLLHVPKNLLKHVDKFPNEVGEVFLALVGEGFFPTFEEEKVLLVLEKLYGYGLKKIADQICNAYFSKNLEFVKPIYQKNQNKGGK